MKIKGRQYTEKRIIRNILDFYYLASLQEMVDGRKWYTEANKFANQLAKRFNITVQQSAGIIAALSPQTTWDVNRTFAVKFLLNPAKFTKKNKAQTDKCKAILDETNEGSIYNLLSTSKAGKGYGLKTKRFFLNILHPELSFVTIDRHAWCICIQPVDKVAAMPEQIQLSEKQYEFIERCYIEASKQVNLRPSELQATVWLVYRRERELKEHSDSPF